MFEAVLRGQRRPLVWPVDFMISGISVWEFNTGHAHALASVIVSFHCQFFTALEYPMQKSSRIYPIYSSRRVHNPIGCLFSACCFGSPSEFIETLSPSAIRRWLNADSVLLSAFWPVLGVFGEAPKHSCQCTYRNCDVLGAIRWSLILDPGV